MIYVRRKKVGFFSLFYRQRPQKELTQAARKHYNLIRSKRRRKAATGKPIRAARSGKMRCCGVFSGYCEGGQPFARLLQLAGSDLPVLRMCILFFSGPIHSYGRAVRSLLIPSLRSCQTPYLKTNMCFAKTAVRSNAGLRFFRPFRTIPKIWLKSIKN